MIPDNGNLANPSRSNWTQLSSRVDESPAVLRMRIETLEMRISSLERQIADITANKTDEGYNA